MKVGDLREVPHRPMVKNFVSSHAAPGTRGEVQNAITWNWSLSTHINKRKTISFVLMKLLFASMPFLQAKIEFDSTN